MGPPSNGRRSFFWIACDDPVAATLETRSVSKGVWRRTKHAASLADAAGYFSEVGAVGRQLKVQVPVLQSSWSGAGVRSQFDNRIDTLLPFHAFCGSFPPTKRAGYTAVMCCLGAGRQVQSEAASGCYFRGVGKHDGIESS